MKVHIIGGGNLGVSVALGLARFSKDNQINYQKKHNKYSVFRRIRNNSFKR